MSQSHTAPTRASSFPVFFDHSGKRWRRFIGISATLLAMFGCFSIWATTAAADPVWTAARNGHSSYPKQLLESGDVTNIPLVGEENGYAFDRIALVEKRGGKTFLTDPFSARTFREATPQEAEEIGDHPYVMETFGKPADRTLMLTFDDGPDARYTPELLDILSEEGVPVTFFMLGKNIVKHPDVYRRVIREGHIVANHTMTHIDFFAHSTWRNREEIIGTDRIMRATAWYSSRLFRIPEGDPHNQSLALLQAQQLGYLHINMDIDTLDWSYAPGEPIPVPKLDGKGHIVLMHDSGGDRSATIAMVRQLIKTAKEQGYVFTTVEPILPDEYVPEKGVKPILADRFTLFVSKFLYVVPSKITGWLFWFGAGSLAVFTLLYAVMAVISKRHHSRKRWPVLAGENAPLVSVILPVYNEAPVVARTLDALRASDYPNFEVIAINDGSTDTTLSILQEYARQWPRLKVIDQPNSGKSTASNNGVAAANGGIIVTLDGDTIFEPQTIRMLVRHFTCPKNGNRIGAVAGHIKVGNRRNVLTAWQSLEYISGICINRMAEGLIGAISITPGACAAWRRELVLAAGGYSHDTLAEDADLTLSIQRMGYKVVQDNDAVAWTEAPMTIKALAKQRLRWTYGNIQALCKHRSMLLRPRYGALGMVTMPFTLLSIVAALLFTPLTLAVAGLSVAAGDWENVALFAAVIAGIHFVVAVLAIMMVREAAWHLLVVPIYRLIYEPLRIYLLYASLVRAIRGRMVGWSKLERTNSVVVPAAGTK